MPGSATAEAIFIVAMMVLILIISFAAVYFFFRTWAKEKSERKQNIEESKLQNPGSEIK